MTEKPLELLNNKNLLKAYSKPNLIQYGKVEEITKGATGSKVDFGSALRPST